jgi:hypothetical protein
VQQNERRPSLHRNPEFEVGEAQTIYRKITAFGHCRSFFSVEIQSLSRSSSFNGRQD